jgi:hypothetical protein
MTEKDRKFGSIWEEIENQTMHVFGLPGQVVKAYFQPMMGDNKKLILTTVDNRPMGAAVPALEEVLNRFIPPTTKEKKRGPAPFGTLEEAPLAKYNLEQSPGYVTITLNS